jgi:hypothetical protein
MEHTNRWLSWQIGLSQRSHFTSSQAEYSLSNNQVFVLLFCLGSTGMFPVGPASWSESSEVGGVLSSCPDCGGSDSVLLHIASLGDCSGVRPCGAVPPP